MKCITIRKRCPKCKKGELVATGNAMSNSVGSSYQHRCQTCVDIILKEKPARLNCLEDVIYGDLTQSKLEYVWLPKAYPITEYKFTKKEQKIVWEK